MFRFRQAAIGDVLVHGSQIDRELIHHWNTDADADGKTEAEVLPLGIRRPSGVGEHEADPRFEVGDDRPPLLDEVIAGAKEATGKPWIGAVNHGGIHSTEEKLGVPAVPSFVSDFVQLPSHGNELGEVAIVVRVVNGEKAGGFGGEADHILPEKG